MRWRSAWWAASAAAILAFACGCHAGSAAHAWSASTGSITWAWSNGMVRVRHAVTGTKVVACATSRGCFVLRTD
jgi:hypothetical protein